jgi:ribosome biogenesis GTPase
MSSSQSGKVIKSTGSWYSVLTPDGQVYECRLKGKFRIKGIRTTNPIAVGDEVDFSLLPEEGGNGTITTIHDRKNYIIRKATKLSKASHIIAANLDQAIVIASLTRPRTSTGFIDRFLTTAEAYHIPAAVVFNKTDLYGDLHLDDLAYYLDVYENAGYKTLITSAETGLHMDEFKDMLTDKVSLLAGHSGVGKSAMLNRIDPTLDLKTGQISDYHEKGKHTTTFAEMFPLTFGGYIIDTPGIKEFGLVEFDKAELGQRFPEFRSRMDDCRFNNCLHMDEPGCAIIRALEAGEIGEFRYFNYLNMLEGIER